MRWYILAVLGLVSIGCRAPAPTLDPFAPYGARVIPPPATGSIGSTNGYYQPPPAGIPGAAPATSQNPLQPVPSVATPPTTPPRTSAVPGGNWQSTSGPNQFGYANGASTPGPGMSWSIPNYGPAQVAQAGAAMPYPPPGTYYAEPIPTAPNDYPPPSTFAPGDSYMAGATYAAQGMPIASPPSPIRNPGYGDYAGDTVYIPHADPYLAAHAPNYGPVQHGWRRRQ